MKKILYMVGLSLVVLTLLFSVAGCQGEQGPIGPQGDQGIQGATGAVGQQGPRGYAGEDGEDGISITWMGTATSAPKSWRVLNYAYYNSYKGKSYIWDGNSWEIWARDGATGATGASGPRGYTGATGATGLTGLAGAAGADGAPGKDGTDGEDGAFPYTIQMGTCTFQVDDTFTGSYQKMEVPVAFTSSFENAPFVFVTATSGTRTPTPYTLWDVMAIATETTVDGFTLKIGSDMEKPTTTVTVNWLAISQ